jgi:hypothetical protein
VLVWALQVHCTAISVVEGPHGDGDGAVFGGRRRSVPEQGRVRVGGCIGAQRRAPPLSAVHNGRAAAVGELCFVSRAWRWAMEGHLADMLCAG